MKLLSKFLTISLFLISVISCTSEDAIPEKNLIFKAYLNGSKSVPANNSAAVGIATFTFNPNTNEFSMIVQYSGLSANSASIYSNHAELIVSFPDMASEITYYGSLSPAQQDSLLSNNFTLKLNSASFPDGEICGYLIRQNDDDFPPPPPAKM